MGLEPGIIADFGSNNGHVPGLPEVDDKYIVTAVVNYGFLMLVTEWPVKRDQQRFKCFQKNV